MNQKLLIYNLFPRLAGNFNDWLEHIRRAKELGFNAIFINPFHYPGFSGSLYAVKDYYEVNPMFTIPDSSQKPMDQLEDFAKEVEKLEMKLIMDLVINHTARDSLIAEKNPKWFKHEANGDFVSPGAWDDQLQRRIIWGDLIEVEFGTYETHRELWEYLLELTIFYGKMGFTGFRCDAAYQVPSEFWTFLIAKVKQEVPEAFFLAETLGCTPDESVVTANTGFDYIFNSSKYWNYYDNWCMDQYELYRKYTKTISFAESHDTERLAMEMRNNLNAIKLKYAFSSIFSSALLIPIGFEYGFTKKLDVVHTTPSDWESINYDISEFIKNCNELKHQYQIFNEDNEVEFLENPNSKILTFSKTANNKKEKVFIILNKDIENYQYVEFPDLYEIFGKRKLVSDISPEYSLDFIPSHFEYHLRPAQIIVLYQKQ